MRASVLASCCSAAVLVGCLTSDAARDWGVRPASGHGSGTPTDPPNVIFVFADDLGYGDLGVYGAKAIRTPRLDGLATSGVLFTDAYAGNSICTPSRAALLTGRYGPRHRLRGTVGGVYYPDSRDGLEPAERTIAELLSASGYITALFGKWHLGHAPEFLPMHQGFDEFFGLPYSNDMTPLPLMKGDQVVEWLEPMLGLESRLGPGTKQATLTGRYTDHALAFIRSAHRAGRPFFLYYATHLPHTPLAASAAFSGKSPSCDDQHLEQACGAYADVMAELDFSVGRILDELLVLGIERNTLVVFTSDNGPWLYRRRQGGSAGLLREGKGTVFEGGFRVPMIASFPGRYRTAEIERTPVVMMDWFSTIAEEAGVELPDDRALDGMSLSALLRGTGPRLPGGEPFRFIYHRTDNRTPGGYREGRWKYLAPIVGREAREIGHEHGQLLFDLEHDPAETNNLADDQPELVSALRSAMMDLHSTLED